MSITTTTPNEAAQATEEEAPRVLRAALAQVAPLLGDCRRNAALHCERIEEARASQADLILFPELSLTGYFLRDMVPDVAMPTEHRLLAELVEAAGPADLALGFVEERRDHRFYNAACYAQAGSILHVHRKVYLPTYGLFDEARYFARGERLQAFDTQRFGRVGLLVCEDFWHLSAITIMQAEGVDFLICLANSPARGIEGPNVDTAEDYQRFCQTYAQLLGAVVIFVNRVGFEDGLCFWGRSLVVGPDGEIIAQAKPFDEELLIAEIDTGALRRERLVTPLARDERLLLTIEELNRIKRARYEK